MDDNRKYLDEARVSIGKFESEKEPERLREAYLALENVNPAKERKRKMREIIRAECLNTWLTLIQAMDNYLDPAFNPDQEIQLLIQPPPTSKGVIYPPGADPELIDDPVARAEYKKAIEENQGKIFAYRMQTYLLRLEQQIIPAAKAFILGSYTSSPTDQAELNSAIEKMIKEYSRQEELKIKNIYSRP